MSASVAFVLEDIVHALTMLENKGWAVAGMGHRRNGSSPGINRRDDRCRYGNVRRDGLKPENWCRGVRRRDLHRRDGMHCPQDGPPINKGAQKNESNPYLTKMF
uniref:Uncharacterized protein n=1 Tax=Photinus pyralis TaxID=7054 RepID=A0A1Y1LKM3_PHOPY